MAIDVSEDLELKYQMVINLGRIADALEHPKAAPENDTMQTINRNALMALTQMMQDTGSELTEIMDNELLDLMTKHRRIRKIADDLTHVNGPS